MFTSQEPKLYKIWRTQADESCLVVNFVFSVCEHHSRVLLQHKKGNGFCLKIALHGDRVSWRSLLQ